MGTYHPLDEALWVGGLYVLAVVFKPGHASTQIEENSLLLVGPPDDNEIALSPPHGHITAFWELAVGSAVYLENPP